MHCVIYLSALALALVDARDVQLDVDGLNGSAWPPATEKTAAAPTPSPTCQLTGPNLWPTDCTCASWAQGDGSGGSETYVGNAATCQQCLQLVLVSYPSAAGATFRAPGSSTSPFGECYVEHQWLYPNGELSWITIPIPKMWMMIPGFGGFGASATSSSSTGAVAIPTAAGSTAAASIPSPAGSVVAATGDPHLQNIHGERFDLMRPGKHVLIHIPRGERVEKVLLRVEAKASRMGGSCADMYFQDMNITGAWVEAQKIGGFRFHAQDAGDRNLNWVKFGK